MKRPGGEAATATAPHGKPQAAAKGRRTPSTQTREAKGTARNGTQTAQRHPGPHPTHRGQGAPQDDTRRARGPQHPSRAPAPAPTRPRAYSVTELIADRTRQAAQGTYNYDSYRADCYRFCEIRTHRLSMLTDHGDSSRPSQPLSVITGKHKSMSEYRSVASRPMDRAQHTHTKDVNT